MTPWWRSLWKSKLLWSYFIDVLLVGLISLPYPFIVTIPPYQRKIWLDDKSIQFPHLSKDHVPSWSLPIINAAIPVVFMLILMACRKFENKKLFVSFIGLFLALSSTVIITNVLKNLVGELRPDFLSRCNPDPGILSEVVCRGKPKLVIEGRKSFPSGHTSSCFASLGYLSFFLAGQLALYDGTGYVYRFILSALPLLGATYVGVTRVMDYRHHWHDVIVGGMLGLALAYLSYRLYFPAIMKPGSEMPHERRFHLLATSAEEEDDIEQSTNPSSGINGTGKHSFKEDRIVTFA